MSSLTVIYECLLGLYRTQRWAAKNSNCPILFCSKPIILQICLHKNCTFPITPLYQSCRPCSSVSSRLITFCLPTYPVPLRASLASKGTCKICSLDFRSISLHYYHRMESSRLLLLSKPLQTYIWPNPEIIIFVSIVAFWAAIVLGSRNVSFLV